MVLTTSVAGWLLYTWYRVLPDYSMMDWNWKARLLLLAAACGAVTFAGPVGIFLGMRDAYLRLVDWWKLRRPSMSSSFALPRRITPRFLCRAVCAWNAIAGLASGLAILVVYSQLGPAFEDLLGVSIWFMLIGAACAIPFSRIATERPTIGRILISLLLVAGFAAFTVGTRVDTLGTHAPRILVFAAAAIAQCLLFVLAMGATRTLPELEANKGETWQQGRE